MEAALKGNGFAFLQESVSYVRTCHWNRRAFSQPASQLPVERRLYLGIKMSQAYRRGDSPSGSP